VLVFTNPEKHPDIVTAVRTFMQLYKRVGVSSPATCPQDQTDDYWDREKSMRFMLNNCDAFESLAKKPKKINTDLEPQCKKEQQQQPEPKKPKLTDHKNHVTEFKKLSKSEILALTESEENGNPYLERVTWLMLNTKYQFGLEEVDAWYTLYHLDHVADCDLAQKSHHEMIKYCMNGVNKGRDDLVFFK